MLGIIILHESMRVWIYLLYKWQEYLFDNVYIDRGIHYSCYYNFAITQDLVHCTFKYTNSCAPTHAYASPYMHYDWMLCPIKCVMYILLYQNFHIVYCGLFFGGSPSSPSVRLKLDIVFVGENAIGEVLASMLSSKVQSLWLVASRMSWQ